MKASEKKGAKKRTKPPQFLKMDCGDESIRRRYNDLTDRFRAEEEKHKQLTARRTRMETESVSIGGMLTELEKLESPPI